MNIGLNVGYSIQDICNNANLGYQTKMLAVNLENMNEAIIRNKRYDKNVLDGVEQWFGVKIKRNDKVNPKVSERIDYRVDST